MNFPQVFEGLKQGGRYYRPHWDAERVIFLVPGSTFKVNRAPLDQLYQVGQEVSYGPHIGQLTGERTISTWTPSQEDLFAEDWESLF